MPKSSIATRTPRARNWCSAESVAKVFCIKADSVISSSNLPAEMPDAASALTTTCDSFLLANWARRLDITTTAEGVETEEQRAKVREMGCVEMKGHLFSRPRPAGEILQFFSRRTHGAVAAASAA